MATSARLFAERGLAGTTMRAIADECGIQAASLYHHFGSKDDLIAAIMTRSSAHVVDLYDQICAADLEPVARFEALIRATLKNFHRHTHEAQMFYDNPTYVAAAPGLQRVRDDAQANDRLWVATIDDTLAAGQLRTDIKPARLKVLLRNMIWSTTRGLRRGKTSTDIADEVVALLLHGCLVNTTANRGARSGAPRRQICQRTDASGSGV